MKKIFLFCILSLSIGIYTAAIAQTTITIGTGTSTNSGFVYPCPYGNAFWGAKHEILLRAAELTALGMVPGDISAFAFNVGVLASPTTLQNFSVAMKLTSSLAATTAFGTGFTTVVAPAAFSVTTGWNTHTLTTPFYWNGTSNLVLQTCFNNTTAAPSNPQMTYTTTSFQSVSTFRQSGTTTVCSALNGTLSANRPNIQITYTASALPPATNFGANPTNTCQNTINFTDSSCCGVTSWAWDFGDSTAIDSTQNPSHTYANAGVYTISLITGNVFGTDTLIKSNFITIASGGANPASCTPSAATPFGNFGVSNVTFNTINNTSASGNIGFEDFACVGQTTVYEGSSYTLSISAAGAVGTQNFRAWIDFNNDGIFTDPAETVLTVNSAASASVLIVIPAGTVQNTALRMRVAADNDFSPNPPTPCGTYDYGQGEDYSVTIIQNTNPPITDFSVNATVSCSGNIVFADLSNNSPTTWAWDFGDSTTSLAQNPTHSYLASGFYTVTLITTNAFGADTLIKASYIQVTLGAAPIPASCNPTTTLYCCGYGVFKVTFGSISNTSSSAIEGYQDFSCSNSTTITEGFSNLLQVQTGTANAQDTRVWIDFNADGNFSTTEQVLTSNNQFNPSANVTVPLGTAVLNTPLRMRVWSDFAGSTPGACANPNRGQVEDYTVFVQPNMTPPLAAFNADITISCGGLVNFIDNSLNTVTSWTWDFGDSTAVSNSQNPTHQYTAVGSYTVSLIVSSIYGTDTLIKTAYVTVVSTNPGPIAPSCAPATLGYCCGVGISNFNFSSLSNATSDGSDGYKDYSCLLQTSVSAGNSYPVSVTTGLFAPENVKIWIDYNNDGSFNNTNELVYTSLNTVQNHTGTISIPTITLTSTPLRMRVVSDENTNNLANACIQPGKGQVEDYGITILPNNNPPVASFTSNTVLTCSGIVNFSSTSTNTTTQVWDFGDFSTSTLVNPTHTYTSSGLYTVKLVVFNSVGSDSVTLVNYINVTLGSGPIAVICSPITTAYCCGHGIYNVTLGAINNTTTNGVDSYKDYSCTFRDTSLEGGQSRPFSVTTGPTNPENVRIFIDYNNNGNFNTANELVYANNSVLTHAGNITVPATGVAFYTNLRMRVISSFLNITNSCNNINSGQVEDYTVFIKNTLGKRDLLGNESLTIFPNPSNGIYQVDYNFTGRKVLAVTVCDVLGRPVFKNQLDATSIYSEKIDLSSFSKGIYILKIVSDSQQITRKLYIE